MRPERPPFAYPDPPLTDGVVLLRRWSPSDLACVEEASRDPEIPGGTTVPSPFTPAEGRAWIERQLGRAANGEGLSLAIADAASGAALGAAVLMLRPTPGTAEVGYWLVERVRGRGLGSRAVALLTRWALAGAALARLQAHVLPDNLASQRLLERVGFRREGYLRSCLAVGGRLADAYVYALLAEDQPSASRPCASA